MASGDVVLETTTGLDVLALASGTQAEGGTYLVVLQLGGESTYNGHGMYVQIGSANAGVGIVLNPAVEADMATIVGAIDPTKTYDIKITEH